MTIVQQKLVDAYTVLVLAERMTIEEVPATPVTLAGGKESTIREQVEIKMAERIIEVLG